MKIDGHFAKVSYEQFLKDYIVSIGYSTTQMEKILKDEEFDFSHIKEIYDNIQLPQRATDGSAGYDFFSPFGFNLGDGEDITIPTGIRCKLPSGVFLGLYPKSGLGFKFGLRLLNTVGIVDEDYYGSDNEGHIHVKIRVENDRGKVLSVNDNAPFCQGMIQEYHTFASEVPPKKIRNGGFGSTHE